MTEYNTDDGKNDNTMLVIMMMILFHFKFKHSVKHHMVETSSQASNYV
jgi:hypothetical protein